MKCMDSQVNPVFVSYFSLMFVPNFLLKDKHTDKCLDVSMFKKYKWSNSLKVLKKTTNKSSLIKKKKDSKSCFKKEKKTV